MRTRSRPGISSPRSRRAAAASRMAATTAGAPHMSVTPWASTRRRISSPSTLRTTTWVHAHRRWWHRACPTPLQWNIGRMWRNTSRSVTAGVPPEDAGVQPAVAMGQLHPFGPRGRAARVVDRAGGVLVGVPRLGHGAVGGLGEERGVLDPVEHDALLGGDPAQGGVDLRVDEQDRGAGVLDDVLRSRRCSAGS